MSVGLRIAGFAVVKGVSMGSVVVGVLHSGLTPFQQALIIALVSAIIGSLGMILSALIGAHAAREAAESAARTEQKVDDMKGALGADRRERDA